MKKRNLDVISREITPLHGHISSPASRAWYAEKAGHIEGNLHNGIESGKFFPATTGGIRDVYAPEDVANISPPQDGKIASGGQAAAAYLDRTDIDWQKHKVYGGELLDFTWWFSAQHKYRRFNYFITRADWDPNQPLARAQFEPTPFVTFLNDKKPYWAYSSEEMWPANPTIHTFQLPEREGHHVIMGVWEIAETDKAFYQVVDFEFLPKDAGSRPPAPTGFNVNSVTYNSVGLKWNAPANPADVGHYILKRNGSDLRVLDATVTSYIDSAVSPLTEYTYTLTVVKDGYTSLPGGPVTVTIPSEDGTPSAPGHLHSMGETTSSISLMWRASTGSTPVRHYIIRRNNSDVQRVAGNLTKYTDQGLMPDNEYSYTVRAEDMNGKVSPESNTLQVRTKSDDNGQYEPWVLGSYYAAGTKASHINKNWQAIQSHTAHVPEWAPGGSDSFTLWKELK